MIARIWEGRTTIEHSALYRKIIVERDIPNYKNAKGFVKLTFLKRIENDHCHFKLITFWEGLDAVKDFAGANPEIAVSYTEDEKYVIDFPGSVHHYDIFAESP